MKVSNLDKIYNYLMKNKQKGFTAAELAKILQLSKETIYKRISDIRTFENRLTTKSKYNIKTNKLNTIYFIG